jgi:phosphotriesterase-related protein
MKTVMGVNGEINADDLGFTLPHEHLFVDLSCYWNKDQFHRDERKYSQTIVPEIKRYVASEPWAYADNIVLTEVEGAIKEAESFHAAGGKTIVDLSPYPGMGRNPDGLLSVSVEAGVNVIMSGGRYSEPSMSDSEKSLTVDEIARRVLEEFKSGIGETGMKPGILKTGFVSSLDKESELRSLRAVGRAQREVGCALSVHPHIWRPDSHIILDILEEEGCDLCKVILCHQDFLGKKFDYLQSLIKRGVYIEFDTFGSGWINDPMWRTDEDQKIDNLVEQINRGNTDHLLISGDMFMKIMLECGGGIGLKNIPLHTLPALIAWGIDPEILNKIVIDNPRRALCH